MADGRMRRTAFATLRDLARWGVTLTGVACASTAALAGSQAVSPATAPAAWLRYGEAASGAVYRLLRADNETAIRLRNDLDRIRPAPEQPTAPLVFSLWVDGDGTVTRIAFTPFAHEAANADLRALLVGQRLAGPPPHGMLLPLRVAVQLDAPPPLSPPASPDRI